MSVNNKRQEESHPIIATNELVYIFCAGAWVNAVFTHKDLALYNWSLAILFFSFCLIPLDYHASIIWQKVSTIFDNSDREKNTKHKASVSTCYDRYCSRVLIDDDVHVSWCATRKKRWVFGFHRYSVRELF